MKIIAIFLGTVAIGFIGIAFFEDDQWSRVGLILFVLILLVTAILLWVSSSGYIDYPPKQPMREKRGK